MPATIEIPMGTISGNKYLRMHWAARSRHNGEWERAIGFRWHQQSAKPEVRRLVIITSHRRKVLDDDNFRIGCKPIIDILTRLNLLRDDSPRWIFAQYYQETISHNPMDKPFTRITIDDYHGSKFHTV